MNSVNTPAPSLSKEDVDKLVKYLKVVVRIADSKQQQHADTTSVSGMFHSFTLSSYTFLTLTIHDTLHQQIHISQSKLSYIARNVESKSNYTNRNISTECIQTKLSC